MFVVNFLTIQAAVTANSCVLLIIQGTAPKGGQRMQGMLMPFALRTLGPTRTLMLTMLAFLSLWVQPPDLKKRCGSKTGVQVLGPIGIHDVPSRPKDDRKTHLVKVHERPARLSICK